MPQRAHPSLYSKDWLEERYINQRKSADAIASELGCSKHAMLRSIKKHGLTVRKHTSRFPLLNDKAWLLSQYVDKEQSLLQIATAAGCTTGSVATALYAQGVTLRSRDEGFRKRFPAGRWGEKASNWKGGRRVLESGYVYIYKPDHPECNQEGYVMEHRLVAEAKLGRYLRRDEDVHHINCTKGDNRPENLEVLTRKEHANRHFSDGKRLEEEQKKTARLESLLRQHGIAFDPSSEPEYPLAA